MKHSCSLVLFTALTLATAAEAAQLFDRAALWRWRPGTNEASTPIEAWRGVGFNDADFVTAPAPFWFGDFYPGGTEITNMQNNYFCIFLRKTFVITNAAEIAGLRLGALVDDGFVAWINGAEVQRVNMADPPGSPVTVATLAQNAAEPVPFLTYTLTNPAAYLVTGTNVIAVQVFQSSTNSSDLGFDASLETILVDTNPPTVLSANPAGGSAVNALTEITVNFSEPVTGVDAFDLRINGSPAMTVAPLSSSSYRFTFPQPPYGTVQITWEASHGIADQALPPNPFEASAATAMWSYSLVDNTPPVVAALTPASGATVRSLANITVVFSENVSGVDAADLLINDTGATGLIANGENFYTFTFPQPATGLVNVAWAMGHGITDQSPASNAFAGGSWTYTLDPNFEPVTVFISEFMTSNTRTLADDFGLYSDWIEIANAGSTAVNLDGWFLTDTTNNYTKWRFPETNLPPGGFLVVFASEENRRVPGAPLHTNFRLAAGGEYLALVKPDGVTIVSEFYPTFPRQAADISYGTGSLTTNQTVIDSNTLVRVRVPANGNDGTTWTTLNYDDSGWTLGTNGVGYGSTNATAADYNAVVQPTQPVGYWRFSETSGTTAVNAGTGASLNGTYSGATLGTAGPRPPQFNGFEANNTAPTFNGTSASVGVNNSLMSGRSAFTIGGWVRLGATPANRTGLFGQNDCVEFGFTTANNLQCWTPSGGQVDLPSFSPGIGNWFHVVAVGNGTNLRLFTNGVLAATGGTATGNYGSSGSTFNIGGNGIFDATGNFFNGQIDEVVVYHRALSTAEITALYQGGLVPANVSVVPYLRTDIGAAMSNVNATAYVRLPFTVTDPANVAGLILRVRHDDGFAAWINGVPVAQANAPATLAYDSAATNTHSPASVDEFRLGAGMLQPHANVLAIQGLNRAATNEDFLVAAELSVTYVTATSLNPVYFTVPTPGAENSGGVLYPGPAILDAAHTPNVPLDADDVVVTARVFPAFNAVASVVLRYRTMFAPEIEVPMADDGLHGDGAAGDRLYGATIPASAATTGQMLRWFIRATDSLGNQSRWPLFASALGSAEYLGTVVNPYYVTSRLPVIHLFALTNAGNGYGILQPPGPTATVSTNADSQAGTNGVAVFYDGELYDNVRVEVRGNTTQNYNKKSHRFDFNREHPFRHPGAGYGVPDRPAPRIRRTSFVADYADPTYMRQGLSFWLCELIGSPGSYYYPVRLQLNGQFYQLANHNDVHTEDLLERLGYDPNGALYNAAGQVTPGQASTGGFDKKTRTWEGNADYTALANAIAETAPATIGSRTTNFFEMFDVPNVLNYLVAARFVHENDDVWANMSLYHDNDGDNQWRIIGFDMNLSWGAIFAEGDASLYTGVQSTNDNHKAHPLYGSSQALALSGPGGAYNRVYDVVFQSPRLREMYLRRLRTMMDSFVQPPGTPSGDLIFERKILEWRDLIAEEARLDRILWGWPGQGGQNNFTPPANAGTFGSTARTNAATPDLTNGVNAMINEFVVRRRQHFYGKHSVTNTALAIGITKTSNAGIPLAQPPDTFVLINRVEFNPASGNQAHEFICVSNLGASAIDMSGWQLGGGVEFTFASGTVLGSNHVLYVSPDVRAFRSRTVSPRGGEGHYVVGPYQGQLSARGEGLFIADQYGRLAATNSYAGAPSAAQEYLRLTELMYHPLPLAGNTNSPEEFEFLELKNISTNVTLNLTGVRFSNGVQFSFTGSAVTNLAPGATVLVVRNQTAFTARYGGGHNIAGQYTGFLDNGGERLTLLDASNEEILDFRYNNTWYEVTDGLGFSLVVVDELAEPDAWGRRSQWRPSGQLDGSPDAGDTPAVVAPILINEVLSRTDAGANDSVELYNPTTTDVNIGGWFLSDDFNTPKKFRLPDGTMIAAGGYRVFTEADFNPGGAGFAFGSDGDEAWLFSGDAATNLTGYVHGFDFGAAEDGVTFGRHVTSQGDEHFVAQAAATPGATNAGPKVGPLVISEIMYRPPDNGTNDNSADEFIEVLNISGQAVSLFDTNHPTNTWKLTGGADLVFPAGRTLAAGEYLLLVNFDPADTALLAAFRARYGVGTEVQIFGPYSGKLDNSADDVELKKPTTPLPGGVPYVLVDKVDYEDAAPWPGGADGYGLSLQRKNVNEYGNDPINWIAALPTAAAATPAGGNAPVITTPPGSRVAVAGTTVALAVNATGTLPLRYQWRFNGVNLPDTTNSTLMLNNIQPPQGGRYEVLVFNAYGSALSEPATVAVRFPPAILAPPQNVRVRVPPDPAAAPSTNVTFGVTAFSFAPLTYQWKFNTVDIPGATGATYTVTNVQTTNEGTYTVMVSDDIGSISASATLTPLVAPTVAQPPLSQTAPLGAQVTFSVAANGNPLPISFRWRKGGSTLTNVMVNGRMSFFTTNVTSSSTGQYSVIITNLAGTVPTAQTVTLLAAPDADGDGIPDSWESLYGFSPTNNADRNVDSDLDGMSNWQEYIAGTDPTNALSYLRVDLLVGGGKTVIFGAISNRTYTVQYADDPGSLSWSNLADVVARTTNRTEMIPDTNSPPDRYYRVVTPRQQP
jgi:hypothetical protein